MELFITLLWIELVVERWYHTEMCFRHTLKVVVAIQQLPIQCDEGSSLGRTGLLGVNTYILLLLDRMVRLVGGHNMVDESEALVVAVGPFARCSRRCHGVIGWTKRGLHHRIQLGGRALTDSE